MTNSLIRLMLLILLVSCSKNETTENEANDEIDQEIVYPVSFLENYSSINKKSSWFRTNISFDQIYDVSKSSYRGFEATNSAGIVPYDGNFDEDKVDCCYYWNDLGQYLYTDLNEDGTKDLWVFYWKAPWPTNANGLHLYVDNIQSGVYDLQVGLTQVRKNVLSDFNNDGKNEITLFSSGYDLPPFPGDSLAVFNVSEKKYTYLSDDIGYFHGGATGDVNNDGYEDIIAYSGGSELIPVHPVYYQNDGSGSFSLNNNIFLNFTNFDNYYTVELFDIDNDGLLDLFLGTTGALLVIKNKNGTFNRLEGINIQTNNNLEVMDIDFFDFDNDNIKEVLVMNNSSGYNGYSLNLYDFDFNNNSEITSNYFEQTTYLGSNSWIKWIHIFDYDSDGDLDIVADGLFGDLNGGEIFWKNEEGKFKRVGN